MYMHMHVDVFLDLIRQCDCECHQEWVRLEEQVLIAYFLKGWAEECDFCQAPPVLLECNML